MPRSIENFNNGIDVDKTVDELAAGNGESVLREFIKEARGAEFLVPSNGNEHELCVLNVNGKGKMIAAFSSYEAFCKSPLPKDKAIILPFMKLEKAVEASNGIFAGITINPNGKSVSLEINKDKKEQPQKLEMRKNPAGEAMKLAKPESVPETILAALNGFFSGKDNVYKAYFLLCKKGEEENPHMFLVIDFDGKKEEFFPKVAEAIRPYMNKGDEVEMAKADLKLMNIAEKITPPFYKK